MLNLNNRLPQVVQSRMSEINSGDLGYIDNYYVEFSPKFLNKLNLTSRYISAGSPEQKNILINFFLNDISFDFGIFEQFKPSYLPTSFGLSTKFIEPFEIVISLKETPELSFYSQFLSYLKSVSQANIPIEEKVFEMDIITLELNGNKKIVYQFQNVALVQVEISSQFSYQLTETITTATFIANVLQ